VRAKLLQIRQDLGALGVSAVLVLAGSVSFQLAVVGPLEDKARRLGDQLEARPRAAAANGMKTIPGASQTARVGEFYKFFDNGERIEDSLAKIYGIAGAAGLQLRAAEYRLSEPRARLERYEISLPVQGTYGQIRLFLETCLRELPTLSLDRTVLRRKNANDTRIEADIVLTLHRLRQ
jgi:hypothetical protein